MRRAFVCFVVVGLLGGHALEVQAKPIQFLVAELPGEKHHGDSFVVVIDDQDMARIQHARALVAWVQSGADLQNAPDDRIVLTNVAPGANGINRNVLAPDEPLWSWHPTGTVDFVGLTAEILDGWPAFIEEDVPGWMANTGGALGFWGYTITQEIGPVPEPTSCVMLALGLALASGRTLRRRPSQG